MILGQDLYAVKFSGGEVIATFSTSAQAKAFCLGMCYQSRALHKHGIISCAGILDIVYDNEVVKNASYNLAYNGD
jgi:hypothetical protein